MINLWPLPLPKSPVKRVSGERVTLRPFEKSDVATIVAQGSDPSVAHWMISFPVPWPRWLARHRIMQARRSMVDGDGLHFAIIAEDLPKRPMIGSVSVAYLGDVTKPPELAYWVAPDWQRQGYARAALSTLLTHLFDRDPHLRAVEAAVIEGNLPSAALLEALGFGYHGDEYARTPLSWNRPRGEQVLLYRYRLWRDHWLSAPAVHIEVE